MAAGQQTSLDDARSFSLRHSSCECGRQQVSVTSDSTAVQAAPRSWLLRTTGSCCCWAAPSSVSESVWLSFRTSYYPPPIALTPMQTGFVSMTIPMYLAETAPPRLRGTLTVINNLFITGGQMIAGLVAGGFSGVDHGWRYVPT